MRRTMTLAAALALVACGGDPQRGPATARAPTASPHGSTTHGSSAQPATTRAGEREAPGAERSAAEGRARLRADEVRARYQRLEGAEAGHPSLTVYVDGPRPSTELEDMVHGAPGPQEYQTAVIVVNEGDASAQVELAHVAFEVWKDDGQRLACSRPLGGLGAPPRLEPSEAHELLVAAVCPFPEAGEYEVRAYVSFGAEQTGGGAELARYHAGRRYVTVR